MYIQEKLKMCPFSLKKSIQNVYEKIVKSFFLFKIFLRATKIEVHWLEVGLNTDLDLKR